MVQDKYWRNLSYQPGSCEGGLWLTNAKIVINQISETSNCNLHHAPLIMDCRTPISWIPQMKMNHCFREANKCVNALATRSLETNQNYVVFDSSPMDISMLLFCDIIGMYYERLALPSNLYFLSLALNEFSFLPK